MKTNNFSIYEMLYNGQDIVECQRWHNRASYT